MEKPLDKFTCICCGFRTLASRCDWDVCPICMWEDDVLWNGRADPSSPANGGLRLSEAQRNFQEYGACRKELVDAARSPVETDRRDPSWRPLTKQG